MCPGIYRNVEHPYCCSEYTSSWTGFELTTLVVIGTDYIGSYKSKYHAIKVTIAPDLIEISIIMFVWYCVVINQIALYNTTLASISIKYSICITHWVKLLIVLCKTLKHIHQYRSQLKLWVWIPFLARYTR